VGYTGGQYSVSAVHIISTPYLGGALVVCLASRKCPVAVQFPTLFIFRIKILNSSPVPY
jgi:hypothetical protein